MSSKNRVTHKKGPSFRSKKSHGRRIQSELLDTLKPSLLAGLGQTRGSKVRRGKE